MSGGEGQEESLEDLLIRYVEARLEGRSIDPAGLCAGRRDLLVPLSALVDRYERIDRLLDAPGPKPADEAPSDRDLPSFPGYRTVERLGRGGGGEVYKLEDLTLGRPVAAKVLRQNSPLAAGAADMLREARSLALFEDPRFVRLLEFRPGDPPVLIMEYVDGFELMEIGPSLEYPQRARLVAEIAEALQHAHELGLQHRDLKPSNILVEPSLRPRILDFGLARGEPDRGHGLGTLAYMAPEQLDPARPIDARTDVYALGVVLYEMLCGAAPFAAETEEELLAAVRKGDVRLIVEVAPSVPEPLQAIALKAMAGDPQERYATARDLARDLRSFLEGRPVLARPPVYRTALGRRVRPHLEQIAEWVRLRLVYPHEAERLRSAYRQLEAREDDWIVQSRVLSFSQIALYLGAFLLAWGSLFYFRAYLLDAVRGVAGPAVTLGLPFVVINVLAHALHRREHRAVAVAFYLGAAALLPLAVLILLREAGLLMAHAGGPDELFEKVTNRQLQVALVLASVWLAVLAGRTRTVALASGFAVALLGAHLTCLGDLGLRHWVEEERWDFLAVGLLPLAIVMATVGRILERRQRAWFVHPLYLGATGLLVLALELLALHGRAFHHLGLTLSSPQAQGISDPTLLDTVVALTANGILFYAMGALLERRGTPLMRLPAHLLHVLSPFAVLEPLAYLDQSGEYSRRFDWLYLFLALTIAVASRFRQRRSFYYAGVINTAVALLLITDHYGWEKRPLWAGAVLLAGVCGLAVGYLIDRRDRVGRGSV